MQGAPSTGSGRRKLPPTTSQSSVLPGTKPGEEDQGSLHLLSRLDKTTQEAEDP